MIPSKDTTGRNIQQQLTIIVIPKTAPMSKVAQKLCDEIVEPALKPSKDSSATRKSSSRFSNQCPKQDSKTTHSIIIEKRKVINKLVPNDCSASRTKYKSKETFLKDYADTAVNTLITGPLKCDNNSVTAVRKRDTKCSCKCALNRLNCKGSVKQVQTFENKNFLTDKACAKLTETANFATQTYLDMLGGGVLKAQNSTGAKRSSKDIMRIYTGPRDSSRMRREDSTTSKLTSLNYMGARRWALSQYPTRGPDF